MHGLHGVRRVRAVRELHGCAGREGWRANMRWYEAWGARDAIWAGGGGSNEGSSLYSPIRPRTRRLQQGRLRTCRLLRSQPPAWLSPPRSFLFSSVSVQPRHSPELSPRQAYRRGPGWMRSSWSCSAAHPLLRRRRPQVSPALESATFRTGRSSSFSVPPGGPSEGWTLSETTFVWVRPLRAATRPLHEPASAPGCVRSAV